MIQIYVNSYNLPVQDPGRRRPVHQGRVRRDQGALGEDTGGKGGKEEGKQLNSSAPMDLQMLGISKDPVYLRA